ncbi:hypothetical protein HDU67_005523 [Dinochytrium kinnereticum]|nr:hypothetical protein HDU67_005523 [Dinochytrium kinnereticum]
MSTHHLLDLPPELLRDIVVWLAGFTAPTASTSNAPAFLPRRNPLADIVNLEASCKRIRSLILGNAWIWMTLFDTWFDESKAAVTVSECRSLCRLRFKALSVIVQGPEALERRKPNAGTEFIIFLSVEGALKSKLNMGEEPRRNQLPLIMDEDLSEALKVFGDIIREHDVHNLAFIHNTGVVHPLIRINDYFSQRGLLTSAFRHKGYPDLLQVLQLLLIYGEEEESIVASVKTAFSIQPAASIPPPDRDETSPDDSIAHGLHALCRHRYIHLTLAAPHLFDLPHPLSSLFDANATPSFEHVKPALDRFEGKWTGNLNPGVDMTITLKWGDRDNENNTRRFFGEGTSSDEKAFRVAASVNLETGFIHTAVVIYQVIEEYIFRGCLLEMGIVGQLDWGMSPTPFWWRRKQE